MSGGGGWREAGLEPGPRGVVIGAYAVLRGAARIAAEPALRRLALTPVILALLLQALLAAAALHLAADVLARLWPRPGAGVLLGLWWVARLALGGGAALLLLPLFRGLVELIGAPFFDRLALHVLAAHGVPVREPGLLEAALPDLARALLFSALAAACALAALVLPLVGVLALALGVVVGVVAHASSALNPALTVTGHGVRARLRCAVDHAGTSLGLGGASTLLLLVPVVGILAVPASVVGASELVARAHLSGRLRSRAA